MTRFPLLPALLCGLVALAADGDKAVTDELVKDGAKFVRLGKYDEALTSFQKAYERTPSPELAATLIQVYPRTSLATGSGSVAKMGLWTQAMKASGSCNPGQFDYLREKGLPVLEWKVSETERQLAEARAQLAQREGEYRIKVDALQATVQVFERRAQALESERSELSMKYRALQNQHERMMLQLPRNGASSGN